MLTMGMSPSQYEFCRESQSNLFEATLRALSEGIETVS